MNRPRDYYRKMRAKHIKRKKEIVSHWNGFEDGLYKYDGKYSKNKIHCSCPLCSSKAYYGKHVKTMQEVRNDISFKEILEEPLYDAI